ncbi:ribosomal protein L23-domain-containing protein [Whalleya microplaca]|nr:ribosomal protein L23-domain-containing protein [Whalleya microplaca]
MASRLTRTFRTGTKQVFLPDHIITFLRPKDARTPQFATFKVPLTFNKLDMRDYLLHAYNVQVTAVRSQLRQQKPRRSKFHHRIFRPPPIKSMTVELVQPFVWPAAPADLAPWNPPAMQRRIQTQDQLQKLQKTQQKTGHIAMRDEIGANTSRRALREEAKRLLVEGGWSNNRKLDPKFAGLEKAKKAAEDYDDVD